MLILRYLRAAAGLPATKLMLGPAYNAPGGMLELPLGLKPLQVVRPPRQETPVERIRREASDALDAAKARRLILKRDVANKQTEITELDVAIDAFDLALKKVEAAHKTARAVAAIVTAMPVDTAPAAVAEVAS